MDNSIAISVENISKRFKVYFDKGTSLKEKVLFQSRRRYEERTVLEDISFQVKKGEAIGIIGHNGCGKSTMLKLLTRIMYPDEGRIVTDGRISALIELGAGFHPDLSGRENIYTNASIFGLSHREITRRLDDIIRFSELGDYVDNPVRTYSSGMYMRLAFSVAINVDADILLVDEILAVGDASFQAKCFNRLREIKAKGTTIVIVSHSLGQIEQICDRSIWIHNGKIRADGLPREVHPAYLNYMAQQLVEHSEAPAQKLPAEEAEAPAPEEEAAPEQSEQEKTRWGSGAVKFTKVRLLDGQGREKTAFLTGEPMTIEMSYQVSGAVRNPACGIGIFRDDGVHCYGVNTQIDHIKGLELGRKGTIRFEVKENLLLPGNYTLDVALHTEDGFAYDYYRYAKTFQMVSQESEAGLVRMAHRWSVNDNRLQYRKNLEKYKPNYVVHGDDWKTGFQKPIRDEVVELLAQYGGRLVEFPYSDEKKYRDLDDRMRFQLALPDVRRARLRKTIEMKGLVTAIEAHNGITGLIAEKTVVYQDGAARQFDAMWVSSLCDSTSKGKPDIELVDMTSRFQTIDDIMEVTTKPIIFDGDTGGLAEHFVYTVRTLERMGVSMVIIEDKTGLKKNSLFGTEVTQTQDAIENFCHKIEAGKRAQKTKEFMIVARIESLILEQGMEDALKRAFAYVKAGADGIMIHSRKKDPAEIFEFLERFRAEDQATPIVVVPTSFNAVTEEEFKRRGVNVVIYANQLTRSGFPAMQETARTILENHRAKEADDRCMPIKEIITLIPEEA